MGNANSNERTASLSRDSYFFITEDVQQRLLQGQQQPPHQQKLQQPPQQQQQYSSPTLADSVADSIRQTQAIDALQRDYEARLAKLEERSSQRFQSAAGQFSAAVNQVEAKFLDREPMPPCCQADKDAMAQCYAANSRYPLRCSQLVEAFERCVTEQRRAFVLRQRQQKEQNGSSSSS